MPTTPRPPAARHQRLHTDERQREIVAAVLALARERGPDAITTQAIADRMGVTQGAVFRHFPDKQAIWLAVFAWVRESLGAVLTAATGQADSPLAKIERTFLAHIAFIVANPGVPRVMFHEMQYPGDSPVRAEVRGMIASYRERLTLLFRQAKAAGELPRGLDATLAPVTFIGAVQGLVIEASLAGDETGMVKRARKLLPLLHRWLSRTEERREAKFGRTAALVVAGMGAALLLGWLVTSQGPLAPVKVTVARAERGPLVARTFGIGTIEARRSHAIGPTIASRVQQVLVDQGDTVKAGQVVAELDPVDLTDRVTSGELAVERAASAARAAEAQLAEAQSRAQVATSVARRYLELQSKGFVSQEAVDAKAHEANAAKAGADAAAAQLAAARRDHERTRADVAGVGKLRLQARLLSPVDGVVSARLVEPGTTVVAGQAIVQVIDPASLWVRARIDQGQSGGVRVGQPAEIVLRSDPGRAHSGEVQRVDWVSDAVTEERIVNVGFADRPDGIAIGELVEVTIRVRRTRRRPLGARGGREAGRPAGRCVAVRRWTRRVPAGEDRHHDAGRAHPDPRRPGRWRRGHRAQRAGMKPDARVKVVDGHRRHGTMINLAARDVLHGWGKFLFTGLGLGLLIGVTLTMAACFAAGR